MTEAIKLSGATPKGRRQYISYGASFRKWCRSKKISLARCSDLTEEIIRNFLKHLESEGQSHSTRLHKLGVIRMTCRRLARRGLIPYDPSGEIVVKRKAPAKVIFWPIPQVLAYLEWAKEHQPNMVSVIALSGLAGLRVYESAYLREQDINFEHGTVTVTEVPGFHTPKTLKSHRTIPVGKFILDQLRWAIDHRQGQDHQGFLSLSAMNAPWPISERDTVFGRAVARYIAAVSSDAPKNFRARNLRTSFITHAQIELGVNPLALRMYVGHSDGSMMDTHYTGWSEKFLRAEVAEKMEGWLQSGATKPVSGSASQ